jgi:hypothetical protein
VSDRLAGLADSYAFVVIPGPHAVRNPESMFDMQEAGFLGYLQ